MSTSYPAFNLPALALQATSGISCLRFASRDIVFHQGAPSDSFYYVLEGKVQLSVVSEQGKEAIISILESDELFGESCLLGFSDRRSTARILTDSRIIRVSKEAALKLISDDAGFDAFLIGRLIKSGLRTQEQLIDQLFNPSEKRLARALLMLANFANETQHDVTIPKVSQEVLAEMIGSSRPRINQFMNKFRKLGYIDYDGMSITIHPEALSALLCDSKNDVYESLLCRDG
ncbi:Crp/Fnr family transcriptional regulator [Methyloceanibacter sp.]|uniref:Crp/Fnr family transcriptional regulator n=1 Tax=Methyloceanibacter sp. TaxID=1965321 RepID=UPI0025E27084|nr:Crp/Fnr family transcriptional regulator [Methyloceanibacter sp.]MCC0059593.1 Crp/Fnr family transcriptional regulator [Hyphomicrobiaceae bacterium]